MKVFQHKMFSLAALIATLLINTACNPPKKTCSEFGTDKAACESGTTKDDGQCGFDDMANKCVSMNGMEKKTVQEFNLTKITTSIPDANVNGLESSKDGDFIYVRGEYKQQLSGLDLSSGKWHNILGDNKMRMLLDPNPKPINTKIYFMTPAPGGVVLRFEDNSIAFVKDIGSDKWFYPISTKEKYLPFAGHMKGVDYLFYSHEGAIKYNTLTWTMRASGEANIGEHITAATQDHDGNIYWATKDYIYTFPVNKDIADGADTSLAEYDRVEGAAPITAIDWDVKILGFGSEAGISYLHTIDSWKKAGAGTSVKQIAKQSSGPVDKQSALIATDKGFFYLKERGFDISPLIDKAFIDANRADKAGVIVFSGDVPADDNCVGVAYANDGSWYLAYRKMIGGDGVYKLKISTKQSIVPKP